MSNDFLKQLSQFRSGILNRNITVKTYCEKWVPLLYRIQINDPKYRKACEFELSRIAKTNEENIIKNWGKHPEYDSVPEYMSAILPFADFQNLVLFNAQNLRIPKDFLAKMLEI